MSVIVKDKSFYKTLFLLSVPIALKNLITLSVGLADNIMVSGLGECVLSGAYAGNQPMVFLQNVVASTGIAVATLSSQYWGKGQLGDTGSIKKLMSIGLRFGFAVGLIAFVMGFFFTEFTVGLFTNERDVIAEGAKYLKIVSVSYLFYSVSEILVQSMNSVESVRIGLVSSVSTCITNVVLNYVLIYGKLGFEPMGIRGAAAATLASRIIELIVLVIYIAFIDKKLRFSLRDLFVFSGELRTDFFRYGLPIIGGGFIWALNLCMQSAIIGRLGETAMSSISVAMTVFNIASVVVYGIASGTSILIGKTVGEGDYEKVRLYSRTLQVLFLIFGLFTAAVMYLSQFVIPYIYTELTEETLSMVRQFILVLAVTSFGTSYQMPSLTGIVRAGGATSFVFLNDTFWVWCVVIPSALAAAFVFHAQPWVVFALLKGDQIYKCFVAVVKVNRFKWIKNLTREAA